MKITEDENQCCFWNRVLCWRRDGSPYSPPGKGGCGGQCSGNPPSWDAELLPGWGHGCHKCPSLFLALQGSACKAVDPCRCFKLLKGLGRVMSNPRTVEMWRQLAASLILLSSSQGKECRDLFVLVLPFVGGWWRNPLLQEGSLFPKNLVAYI